MTGEDRTDRIVYRLEGQLALLLMQVEKTAEQIETNRLESKEDRRSMYQELRELHDASREVKTDVSSLVKQMEADKQIVAQLQQWKQRVIGMRMLASVQIAVAIFALSAFTSLAMRWIGKKIGLD